jgi:uncharacterized protein (DUF779 family)
VNERRGGGISLLIDASEGRGGGSSLLIDASEGRGGGSSLLIDASEGRGGGTLPVSLLIDAIDGRGGGRTAGNGPVYEFDHVDGTEVPSTAILRSTSFLRRGRCGVGS